VNSFTIIIFRPFIFHTSTTQSSRVVALCITNTVNMVYTRFGDAETPPASPPDVTLTSDIEDTISALSWSPAANHLAAASWDGKVRIFEVAANGTSKGVAMLTADGPLLSCDWSKVCS
jgi:WD40 repeat protein